MKMLRAIIALLFMATIMSCSTNEVIDPLPSWKETEMKTKIVDFIENEVPKITVENRLAVFDMDGTIACEEPLWLEMYCAVEGLCLQSQRDTSLKSEMIYQLADSLKADPNNEWAHANWGPYIDEMVRTAFTGWDNEKYVKLSNEIVNTLTQPNYDMLLINTFYPPMLELITYLKENRFDVYIVSGSLQGLLWSVCPQAIGFDRDHLIGTRQAMNPVYYPGKQTEFILLKDSIWNPGNNNDGKAQNIYSHIGKTPVFAFGNTTGDFGMFHLTSTNPLPNISFLLNHNDSIREYNYDPWHGKGMPAWRDTMSVNGWNIVDMEENFNVVFEK